MKTHVKKVNLIHAIKVLADFDILYKVEEGICFGKDVYWIELHSESENRDEIINALRAVAMFGEDSDEVHGVHIDDAAHNVIERVLDWHLEWKASHRNYGEEYPLVVPSNDSGVLYASIVESIFEK